MEAAVREARAGLGRGEGGPFGAVVVRGGTIVARAHNRVVRTRDPTAHAEVLAIRKASRRLGRFDLSDCEIYATSEPCPMCLGAILWARIPKLTFGCSKSDAAAAGFDDARFHKIVRRPTSGSGLKISRTGRKACLELFREWAASEAKVPY